METRSFSIFKRLVLIAIALFWCIGQAGAEENSYYQKRQDAWDRLGDAMKARHAVDPSFPETIPQDEAQKPSAGLTATPTGINPAVDIALPNYANSPNLRKFVNKLPGVGAPGCSMSLPPGTGSCNENEVGQYIPLANPDQTTYPATQGFQASDYYEIGLSQYNQQLHSDLPAVGTKLRGYYQINNGTKDFGLGVATDHSKKYLGPLIIAERDKPVRIKFVNQMGINGAGDFALPVDTNIMGAGLGPLGPSGGLYTENRADLHLHGGLTPWISDGTPHQWITPANDATPYKKGASFQNVPDMVLGSVVNGTPVPCIGGAACFTPSPGDGIGTYYYTNQQSARLLFYHDHAYGITRLNVYAGEAAGYLIVDQVEKDLIEATNLSHVFDNMTNTTPRQILPDLGGVYHYGIPLVIQDRTFVQDASTQALQSPLPAGYAATPLTAAVDPLWPTYVPNAVGGDFWIGHEYMPNENIYDPSGFNVMGRWDYGPWMIPPMVVLNNTLPSPTIIPEAFMDTMIVNGTPFPYVELPKTAVRFRILNACNDRMLNLQLYFAKDMNGVVCKSPNVFDAATCTEVSMVPAGPVPGNPLYDTWPKDGRDGGVPDPATAGPDIWQIGNEAGFLAQVAVVPPQPVDFDYNRRSVTFGGVTSKSLYIPSAVRADVVVDFSPAAYAAGDILILYNDAPAPMPLFDTRYDYFTDDLDQTGIGGAPRTPRGFGPNTRTIMQIKLGAPLASPVNLPDLQNALPKAFAKAQHQLVVPAAYQNAVYNPVTPYTDIYANSVAETLNVTGTLSTVARVITELPGQSYTLPPVVTLYGGGVAGGTPGTIGNPGVVATATASLNGVTAITLVTAGSGYTSPPAVNMTGGGGTGATAAATISGGVVTTITITNLGSNYTTAPVVTISGGGGAGATAVATITLGSVGSITVNNAGSGYLTAPRVYVTPAVGGGGTGAMAAAMLTGDMFMTGKNLVEGFDMEFGRMNAQLGSTPNPLAPTVGAGPVIGLARYIDPPTEILTAGEAVLWRLNHLGVDSHAIHFHLFDVQVVNRVDWTNTIKPPYEDELGWKETIRTNPFEDIILAIRPLKMTFPFPIPRSNRLLDPTTTQGSTQNFQPVLPPIGIPAVAQISNVPTDFGWEYVWHCHLLGHEENDMMRPIVFIVPPPVAPTGLAGSVAAPPAPLGVNLTWGPAAVDPNTDGYTIQRATNTGFTSNLRTFTLNGNAVKTYLDNTVVANTRYYYRVRAFSTVGTSAWSNTATVITVPPPGNFAAAVSRSGTLGRVALTWTATGTISNFTLQRATNATFTSGLSSSTISSTARAATQFVTRPRTYYYRIRTNTNLGSSSWSPTLTVVVP
jgi:FtsP/CotA-like multicopper oxidase with cupredoxin domain